MRRRCAQCRPDVEAEGGSAHRNPAMPIRIPQTIATKTVGILATIPANGGKGKGLFTHMLHRGQETGVF